MSSDGPLALNRYLPSGERAMPHGRVPTLMLVTISSLCTSITDTVPEPPLLPYRKGSSLPIFKLMGRSPVRRVMDLMGVNLLASITLTKPTDSEGTKAIPALGRNATLRGRGGTLKWPTTVYPAVSMASTSPPLSQVT